MSRGNIQEAPLERLKLSLEMASFRGEMRVKELMSEHTSLKIGGPVDAVVFPEDAASLKSFLIASSGEKMPFFVLGGGTNLLVKDSGVDGNAISLKAFRNIKEIENIERIAGTLEGAEAGTSAGLFVESGVPLGRLINYTKEKGYSGLEALAGIPGSFGGAVYMNAGAFGSEIKDVIVSVALMKTDGEISILKKDQLKFSYRSSNLPEDSIILSANIILRKDSAENVAGRIREFLGKKRQSQPLGKPSAGCVFKNPVGIDSYREGDSAGRLIEAAGCKGMRAGDEEVSNVHANYFINNGNASGKDFLELMGKVKAKVQETSGVMLEPEIKIIGKD